MPRRLLRLLCVVDRTRLPNHADLDLAGVFEFRLDALGNVLCEDHRVAVADTVRLDDDANLAAGLDGIGRIHAFKGIRNLFELFKTLDVALERLASRTGARRRNGVRRLNEDRLDGLRLDVSVCARRSRE